jgi:hypothetical protein
MRLLRDTRRYQARQQAKSQCGQKYAADRDEDLAETRKRLKAVQVMGRFQILARWRGWGRGYATFHVAFSIVKDA